MSDRHHAMVKFEVCKGQWYCDMLLFVSLSAHLSVSLNVCVCVCVCVFVCVCVCVRVCVCVCLLVGVYFIPASRDGQL